MPFGGNAPKIVVWLVSAGEIELATGRERKIPSLAKLLTAAKFAIAAIDKAFLKV